jgi:acetyl coenzyme A synthetase (ADP forming)-like protein
MVGFRLVRFSPKKSAPPSSLQPIFRPRSVAVVGASTRPDSIGGNLVANLFRLGFKGKIFPINPHAEVLHSVKCYPSVLKVPDRIDCALISVPKEKVLKVVAECGRKGIRGLVVITAGFREVGAAGARLEEKLKALVSRYRMRMIGPNCMGVINAEPEYSLDATFSPTSATFGPLAFASQSGALGVAILNVAQSLNLGFTQFVSMGNKANVSSNDLLEFWEHDDRTRIIALYLESFGNPQKFIRLARRITKKKPILVVKSGRTVQGARAASSHTGALAGSEVAIDAILETCGVVRCDTIEDLFDLASALTSQPLPRGDRIAVLTNAGGPAIMATDALIQQGLQLAELSESTRRRLAAFLPPEASLRNPVDMIASATDVNYGRAMKHLLADRAVDGLVVINVTPVLTDPHGVSRQVAAAARRSKKPVLGVFMATEDFYADVRLIPSHPPVYRFPEPAARVMADLRKIGRWQSRPEGRPPRFRIAAAAIRKILSARRRKGGGYLGPAEGFGVLAAAGIPSARFAVVRRPSDVAPVARGVGFPLVLKVIGEKIVHKSEVGGVIAGIRNRGELEEALARLRTSLARAGVARAVEGYLLQEQVSGREFVIGSTHDDRFGPLVMFGLGGKYVEIFKDVKFVLPPASREEVLEAFGKLKSSRLLAGVRGEKPGDEDFFIEMILRVCRLAEEFPEIAEMDINPLFVGEEGKRGFAADVRIRVAG